MSTAGHSRGTTDRDAALRCPQCGAARDAAAVRCWLCHAAVPAEDPRGRESFSADDFAASQSCGPKTTPDPGAAAGQQFSIATILLVTTLIAVCLGVFRISPGFGLAVIAFAVPALIRTFVVGVQHQRVGQRLSIGDKLTAFVASLGIMVLIGIAAVVAFQIACWGTCGLIAAMNPRTGDEEMLLWTSIGIGTVAALAVGGWVLWATRPREG
jgi:hypothetical protein